MSRLPTDVSRTYSVPAAAVESHTRISRQAMDAAGLQRGKSAAALGLVSAAARNGLWCAKAGPNRIFPLHTNTSIFWFVLVWGFLLRWMKRSPDLASSPRDGGLRT